jgi:hypothetical protein
MKTFVHYDSKGAVRALVTVQGPDHVTASLTPLAGNFAVEIEDLKLDMANPDLAHIRKIAKGIKIEPARTTHPKQNK